MVARISHPRSSALARDITTTAAAPSGLSAGEPEATLVDVDAMEPLVPKSPWHTNRIYRQ